MLKGAYPAACDLIKRKCYDIAEGLLAPAIIAMLLECDGVMEVKPLASKDAGFCERLRRDGHNNLAFMAGQLERIGYIRWCLRKILVDLVGLSNDVANVRMMEVLTVLRKAVNVQLAENELIGVEAAMDAIEKAAKLVADDERRSEDGDSEEMRCVLRQLSEASMSAFTFSGKRGDQEKKLKPYLMDFGMIKQEHVQRLPDEICGF